MQLPESENLPINELKGVLDDTTNSYKFYWFLAILDESIETEVNEIPYDVLIRKMISTVWYPLNNYKLSFGKADSFIKVSEYVSNSIVVDNSIGSPDIFSQIKTLNDQQNKTLGFILKDLIRWVPYRFIRPFFWKELKGKKDSEVNKEIKFLANQASKDDPRRCPYSFTEKGIIINHVWRDYFNENHSILKSFIYWHLCRFVQRNNPNVIGVSEKLFKPYERSMNKQKNAWRKYLSIKPETTCIYSGTTLSQKFSLDHFIPWTYVVHDQNWNLIPSTKSINSSKCDFLPDLNRYFLPFSRLQYDFLLTIYPGKSHKAVIEDYCILFGMESEAIIQLPYDDFAVRLRNTISPLIQNATNMGFREGWFIN